MIVKASCPACSSNVEFDHESAGQSIDCPHCGRNFVLTIARKEVSDPRAIAPKPPPVKGREDEIFSVGGIPVKTRGSREGTNGTRVVGVILIGIGVGSCAAGWLAEGGTKSAMQQTNCFIVVLGGVLLICTGLIMRCLANVVEAIVRK